MAGKPKVEEEDLITMAETARLLGESKQNVSRWRDQKKLTARRRGARVLFVRSEVLQFQRDRLEKKADIQRRAAAEALAKADRLEARARGERQP
jgi:excisionase family DNA binding protein